MKKFNRALYGLFFLDVTQLNTNMTSGFLIIQFVFSAELKCQLTLNKTR